MLNFFITGTDTAIGKTWFTVSLMAVLKKNGFSVMGMKPFATGATITKEGLINEDARLIMQSCSKSAPYNVINPFVCELPTAPTIAANRENVSIDLDQIIKSYNILKSMADVMVVEGIGGWRVHITNEYYLLEFVKRLNLSVILVVGIRLGCINHAILTAEAIRADGLNLYGWVSTHLDRVYSYGEETVKILNKTLNCPHIADFGYSCDFDPERLAGQIDPAIIPRI